MNEFYSWFVFDGRVIAGKVEMHYTPAYIVEYIVRNTVGKLCDNKTPKQISNLKILDPACGSGSFLIGAYDYLVAYHRDWYLKDGAEKHTKEVYQGAGGLWHLTTQEKKRILLNNIYGVDIDRKSTRLNSSHIQKSRMPSSA